MINLEEIKNFDELCSKIFKQFLECIDSSMLMHNHFNDRLTWIDYLSTPKVRLVLTAVLNNYKKSDLVPKISKINDIINESFINETGFNSNDISKVLILSAISSLQLYVTDNFLCFINPSDNKVYADCLLFVEDLFQLEELIHLGITSIKYDLDIDGEKIRPIARNVSLLKLARIIFTNLMSDEECVENDLENLHILSWSLRCAIIHQISLNSPTSSIYEEILSYISKIIPFIEDKKQSLTLNKHLKQNLLNEIINYFLWYGDLENSKKYLSLAQNLSDIEFNLTGCLGVKTQFQTKPCSQLKVQVKRLKEPDAIDADLNESTENPYKILLPKNEMLEDDTLLQEVKFIELNENYSSLLNNIKLNEAEQCLMTNFIKFSYRFGSSTDGLLREELLAYIYYLLQEGDIWCVVFVLLELRSLYERKNRRRVERSMKQIETLSNIVRDYKGRLMIEAYQRMNNFYSVMPSPFWIIEKHLADLLISLGVVKSALEVYLRLELWTEVIDCYRQLGRPDKAEEIVRRKLEENGDEQPDLHCLLGELTGDIEYYKYSWDISGQKYARAPKMLGLHYFALKEFDKALEYFWDSIKVNSMQTDVWYRIGYIGLLQEDWELAANAYRRVLQFDNESFEAWNNLSKAYIKLGDKTRAWHTLQEAIKCNFEEWKLWENYAAVCADVGSYSELIEAWNRLIDLKGKFVDDQLARILVKSIIMNDSDKCENIPASRLIDKALKLFGRLTSTSSGSSQIWHLYAKLLIHNKESEVSKITQCLQKSYRQLLSNEWTKDIETVMNVLDQCAELGSDYLFCVEANPNKKIEILNPVKLSLNSVIVQTVRAKTNFSEMTGLSEQLPKLNDKLQTLEERYKQIITQLEE